MKIVILINPFVSPEYLSNKLKANNIYSIALYSTNYENIDDYSKPRSDFFDKQIFMSEQQSLDDICNTLKTFNPDYIINGAEESTELTDRISHKILPYFSNRMESSNLRFDKYLMQESLRKSGLPHISQIKTTPNQINFKELSTWSYPLFIKPNQGYGSINAFKINNINELTTQVGQLQPAEEYLIQEFIYGIEYIVDTFSINKMHYLSNVMIYSKKIYNKNPLYRYADVVTNIKLVQQIEKFIFNVLDCLDFQNGMAHSEIIITETGEIKLIELNNRISGAKGFLIKAVQAMGLSSHDEIMINHIKNARPYDSRSNISNYCDFLSQGYARCVFLFNIKQEVYANDGALLRQLEVVKKIKFLKDVNSPVVNNISGLLDCSCMVLLYANDPHKVEAATDYLFSLENIEIN
ncbi:MAG: ATP-grasp domain-containing protein [Burkholderiales bacterium]|nr:ATP-grasp domain-containing protein [Burkholderiales bacterium]MBP9768577.1 ATP-grasp domain-containing protein [Burkholderiales bacterium]